ncbi:MAG TPA: RDD family protein [Burkholderiales bacterium]|nr:RDD family protein [Burkholderiales bacterium]
MADNVMTSREPRYVGFWMRVFASIIDSLILVVFIGLIAFAVYGMQYVRLSSEGKTLMFDLLVQGLLPALAVIVFWRYRGATPGKMLISAKIVDAETLGTPSTGQLIGRYFAYIVSCIFMLGFIWIAFDRRKQGWHDKLAGTVVIQDGDD